MKVLNDQLCQFFLVVAKVDGFLYPFDNIMDMFHCFGHILRREQYCRLANTGVVEVPFDICKNPIFKTTIML